MLLQLGKGGAETCLHELTSATGSNAQFQQPGTENELRKSKGKGGKTGQKEAEDLGSRDKVEE